MAKHHRPVFFIGPRACGKTSVGQRLARILQRRFIDTDQALQERCGCTIADMTARHGWEYFRDEESRTLELCTAPDTIIATGGGMVLRAANRDFMRRHGNVFYLCAPADILAARLCRNPIATQRPSLTGKSIAEEAADILRQRAPLYEGCARHIVDATLPLDALLRLIIHNI
ncbi:MAG: shikimate kinase AroL [Desulfovibrionaceae bacterium]|nr:shikimate kinase AroL [Desulfovibrionaceae bacterium]